MWADGITRIYLKLTSVDSNMSPKINAMGLTLCTLSTRELQRLRNEVALKRWLLQNFESVVSMYEDRFELSVLRRQKHEDPLKGQIGKSTWWKKFTFRKSATLPSLNYVLISPISLPVKTTKELRALTGWRYYFSLFLEFSDITVCRRYYFSLVKTVFTKVTNAYSFFLVHMVRRSLGLIFTWDKAVLGLELTNKSGHHCPSEIQVSRAVLPHTFIRKCNRNYPVLRLQCYENSTLD